MPKTCKGFDRCYLTGSESRVTDQTLALMGRGFAGRKSDQNLAVACVGRNNSCNLFRFVYFLDSANAFWIGPFLKANDLENKGKPISPKTALAKGLKAHLKEDRSDWGLYASALGVFVGGIILIPVTGGWSLAGLGAYMMTAYGVQNSGGDAEKVINLTTPIQNSANAIPGNASIKQGNWNWESKPKTIREKTFKKIINDLQNYELVMNNNGWKKYIHGVRDYELPAFTDRTYEKP